MSETVTIRRFTGVVPTEVLTTNLVLVPRLGRRPLQSREGGRRDRGGRRELTTRDTPPSLASPATDRGDDVDTTPVSEPV